MILIIGAYFIIKAKQIREGEAIGSCGSGTTIYLNENLCWQKYAWPDRAENWQDANNYCETLTLADNDNWRLPTKEELISILEEIPGEVDINQEVFKNTETIQYWSSSEYKQGLHWYVHFENGYQGYSQNFNSNYGVRCVRDIIFY